MSGLGDEIRREPAYVTVRQARADEHAVLGVATLLDRRPERVQVRERPPFLVRHEQPDILEPIGETRGDEFLQLGQPSPVAAEISTAVREPVREPPTSQRIEEVDLVEHEFHGHVFRSDLGQDAVDG